MAAHHIARSLSPCFSLSLPLVSCPVCHAEKLLSLSSPAAGFILVPPTGTFLASFCTEKRGGGKPDRGRQHLGEPGEQPCSFPELGFYCRRCIPWEGGCACVGAFPHSGQLLFNEGLHAGQTPEEIFAVLGSHPGSAAARTPDAGMDRVVEITPAEEAALGSSQASRMHLGKDLRRIRCAVLLCLLSVLVLALPIAYLLVGNLRAPSSCAGQVRVGRTISILPPCEEESAMSRVSRVGFGWFFYSLYEFLTFKGT